MDATLYRFPPERSMALLTREEMLAAVAREGGETAESLRLRSSLLAEMADAVEALSPVAVP